MIRISGESSTRASKIIGAAQNDSYKKEAMDSVQEKTVWQGKIYVHVNAADHREN